MGTHCLLVPAIVCEHLPHSHHRQRFSTSLRRRTVEEGPHGIRLCGSVTSTLLMANGPTEAPKHQQVLPDLFNSHPVPWEGSDVQTESSTGRYKLSST